MSALSSTLPHVPATALSKINLPTLKIRTDEDVTQWKLTSGYRAFIFFLRRLNESVVGYELPLQDDSTDREPIIKIMTLLDGLDSWIDDIPPQPTPQRFGNLAFRDYGARLEEVILYPKG
ncbi:hypothetical protein Clacol_002392 [Clathrus columnatus]|uniref:Serine/threonine-protein phosphatase 2A activator n=1 Tax=Clathrus columnatus TaxID=1419009 RepID=A0AAV5A611_9AGAM|nr:hypothetical protein Clacol_002392 [Clathrus columnatus]